VAPNVVVLAGVGQKLLTGHKEEEEVDTRGKAQVRKSVPKNTKT
jgi:hypothetical protein